MTININRQQYPLSKKFIPKNTILSTFKVLIILAGTTIIPMLLQPSYIQVLQALRDHFLPTFIAKSFILNSGLLNVIYLSIIFFILSYPYQILYYKSYDYQITDDHVIIKKGVFSSTQVIIPFERIQDIYVDQDFLDQIFGLADLHFTTATLMSTRASHIDGLTKEAAEALRNLTLTQVKLKVKTEGPTC